jgi:hypothetical protein
MAKQAIMLDFFLADDESSDNTMRILQKVEDNLAGIIRKGFTVKFQLVNQAMIDQDKKFIENLMKQYDINTIPAIYINNRNASSVNGVDEIDAFLDKLIESAKSALPKSLSSSSSGLDSSKLNARLDNLHAYDSGDTPGLSGISAEDSIGDNPKNSYSAFMEKFMYDKDTESRLSNTGATKGGAQSSSSKGGAPSSSSRGGGTIYDLDEEDEAGARGGLIGDGRSSTGNSGLMEKMRNMLNKRKTQGLVESGPGAPLVSGIGNKRPSGLGGRNASIDDNDVESMHADGADADKDFLERTISKRLAATASSKIRDQDDALLHSKFFSDLPE